MNRHQTRGSYIEELKRFIAFLQTLWGILAGISVFFPLSNSLIGTIPLGTYGEDGIFDQLQPSLITTLATVVTLFVVLVTFTERDRFYTAKRKSTALHNAWLSFGIGVLSLLVYLAIHQAYQAYAWDPLGWGSGDPRKLLAEIPLLITYVIFFSLITRAFMLLGMIEFFGRRDSRDKSGQTSA